MSGYITLFFLLLGLEDAEAFLDDVIEFIREHGRITVSEYLYLAETHWVHWDWRDDFKCDSALLDYGWKDLEGAWFERLDDYGWKWRPRMPEPIRLSEED